MWMHVSVLSCTVLKLVQLILFFINALVRKDLTNFNFVLSPWYFHLSPIVSEVYRSFYRYILHTHQEKNRKRKNTILHELVKVQCIYYLFCWKTSPFLICDIIVQLVKKWNHLFLIIDKTLLWKIKISSAHYRPAI